VALEYNGISHVVMLASPNDLEDFALGFSLTEGIIANASELYDAEVETRDDGLLVHLHIASERFAKLKERRRNMTGRTGCGLCGTEALDQVRRVVSPVTHRHRFADHQLMAGMRAMQALQPLQQQSGATHAAAWMNARGEVTLVREDVGRHNALDKLIGALVSCETDFSSGALLITSRASYEMVQKAALMNIGLIAAISAPTSLAVDLAASAGLTLIGFMRDHSYVIYTHPERLEN
jgi:FdhD protein